MALFTAASHAATHIRHHVHESVPAKFLKARVESKVKLIQRHLRRKYSSRRVTLSNEEENLSGEEERRYRIHPHKRFKIIWDMVLMLVILYSIVVIPYRLAAHVDAEGAWLALETSFDVFFGMDLILNFFTSYIDPKSGELETRLGMIAKNYLRHWFVVDFLSTIPMDLITEAFFDNASNLRGARLIRAFRLVKLVRLSRLMKVDELLESFAHSTGINAKCVLLLSLSFNQLLFAHLFACLWLGISSPRSTNPECRSEYEACDTECVSQNNWIFANSIQCNTPTEQYMVSLYWSFATMTTVGYGDVRSR